MNEQPNAMAVPNAVPVLARDSAADMPFAEDIGAEAIGDGIDPDLRHRLISEAAYAMYVQRGNQEGDQIDDWLRAEAQIDQSRVNAAEDPGAC